MDLLNRLYEFNCIMVLILLPPTLVWAGFWIIFLIRRIIFNWNYYISYKRNKLMNYEGITNLPYKYRVEFHKYSILLMILIGELFSFMFFLIGVLLMHTIPLHMNQTSSQHCTAARNNTYNLWNAEFSSYSITIFYHLGHAAFINVQVLAVLILMYLCKVYTNDFDNKPLKRYLRVHELTIFLILVLTVPRQTLLISKVIIPVIEFVLICRYIYYTRRMVQVLNWRCVDAWHLTQDETFVKKQKYVLRNFKILSIFTIIAHAGLVLVTIVQQLMVFVSIVTTDDSYILKQVYNWDFTPIFTDCQIQQKIFLALDVIESLTIDFVSISILCLLVPSICITIAYCTVNVYKKCMRNFYLKTRFTPELTESFIRRHGRRT